MLSRIRFPQSLSISPIANATASTAKAFLLQASLRAFEGTNEVCYREWDRSIPRDFM
jgi:hypothetical protein